MKEFNADEILKEMSKWEGADLRELEMADTIGCLLDVAQTLPEPLAKKCTALARELESYAEIRTFERADTREVEAAQRDQADLNAYYNATRGVK